MVIYRTTNSINKKWYIGKDATNNNSYIGSGKALKNAILKYGSNNFKKEIIEECSDLPHLAIREAHWILVTNAVNDPMSYNLVSGGNGGDRSKFNSKGWYISTISDSTETYITNIAEWCRINKVSVSTVSRLTNPSHALFQKQSNGWRFRKENQPLLPQYINKQKIGHPNKACKGKSWQIVNGKRIWNNSTGEAK
jgi:hypothetical protein